MRSFASNPRRSLLILSVAVVVVLAVGVGLALMGARDAAIKLALFGMLAPAVPLFAVLLLAVIRTPDFLREPRAILLALVSAGAVLFVVPLLVWLPFSPMRWQMNDVPPLIAVPLAIGIASFTVGVFGWLFMNSTVLWRQGHRVVAALQVVILVVIPVWIVARMLLR